MATKPKLSEAEALEQYRIALENAKNQPEIASVLLEFGYDSETIEEGKSLLAETKEIYEFNKTEDDETAESYERFSNLRDKLEERYSLDRKKAKVVFRKDAVTREKLGVAGIMPQAYIKRLETAKKLYNIASADNEIQKKLGRLKITSEYITETNTLISELETSRTDYLREKGESQDATKAKDSAFVKMDDWMSEFYEIAKIALEENPQLLEALGKLVRS